MCRLGVRERLIFDFVGRGFFRPAFALVVAEPGLYFSDVGFVI